jgi:hypothetical protein
MFMNPQTCVPKWFANGSVYAIGDFHLNAHEDGWAELEGLQCSNALDVLRRAFPRWNHNARSRFELYIENGNAHFTLRDELAMLVYLGIFGCFQWSMPSPPPRLEYSGASNEEQIQSR